MGRYVVEVGGSLADLSQDLRKGVGVALKLGAKFLKLWIVLEAGKQAGGGGMARGRVLGDAVEEVLYGPFDVSEGRSEGRNALLAREAHGHHIIDLGLGGLGGRLSLALFAE